MTVSVIIATYRRDYTLKRAIESVINQTYDNFEIVVVDDNANAEWNSKVQAIIEDYPQIVYIHNLTNKGSAESRNIGIKNSNGEYITFLDDDDIYLADKIKNQAEFMQENNLDYSITDLWLYNESDKLIEKRTREYINEIDFDSLLKYHFMYHMTGTDTMMFRTDYLRKIGGFDAIDVGDEFYLMKKAIYQNGKFGYLPTCDVKAYVHTTQNNLSSGSSKINGENELFEYKKNFFENFDLKTVKYIKMRHYAVLAFAHMRMKNLLSFILCSFKSFFCTPIECVKLFIGRKI